MNRRWWLVLLGGAPFALGLGLWLRGTQASSTQEQMTTTRESALAVVKHEAQRRGLNVEGWHEAVSAKQQAEVEDYLRRRHVPEGPARRLAPAMVAEASLFAPDYASSIRVRLGPQGQALGVEESGRLTQMPAQGSMERVELEGRLKALLPGGAALQLNEPETTTADATLGSSTQHWKWHATMAPAREVDYVVTAETRGAHLGAWGVKAELPEPVARAEQERTATLSTFLNVLRIIDILVLVGYGLYRFTRRALDREVPRDRAILLFALLCAFGLLLNIANPDLAMASLEAGKITALSLWLIRLAIFANLAMQGLLLGLAYAASEGDLRDAYPAKLTSLDAMMTGRVLSRNTGESVVAGAAFACWLVLIYQGVAWLAGPESLAPARLSASFAFGRMPWLVQLIGLPTLAMFTVTSGLLLPLTFLLRNAWRARWRYAALVLLCLVGCSLTETPSFQTLDFVFNSVALAAAVLAPFFVQDLLASIACVMAFQFLTRLIAVTQSAAAYRALLWPAVTVAAVTFALAIWQRARGRRYSEEEVRPQYAKNLAQRKGMEAEIRAARNAQQLLLPRSMPTLPGVSIAASCLPAGLVGGDFYDLFVLTGGRLGFVLAEGGNDGLASALTIALAKGFLLEEVGHEAEPVDVARTLNEMLGRMLTRSSGTSSLAYGVLDPRMGRLKVARIGAYPEFYVVGGHAESRRLAFGKVEGGIDLAEDQLKEGDLLVAFTDGVPNRLEQRSAGEIGTLVRKAAGWRSYADATALHDTLQKELLGAAGVAPELRDDLTLLVVGRKRREILEEEEVA